MFAKMVLSVLPRKSANFTHAFFFFLFLAFAGKRGKGGRQGTGQAQRRLDLASTGH